ncbi:hypothetical protein VC83_04010 [Pseudogymnoascus destructans]|uniref:Aminoglycoside phosphotransferase domain-containing protein n=2 Tax=Pseudogymnoascus destructans TaxID=655981 RepID=L8FV32_PSED2|nr:uncharacterized protein VC83_04010 [Pseudogymnoascus destructans]ELR04343.1 hypothetical protein GMDG_06724 [Pseudogymnoascus destructans 20631-21]OAF59553.1 hypothetical protein VC83_04010 [Pseudogymnoascus destructans]
MKTLTKQIVGSVDRQGPFKLFLDDIRFGNILVDSKTFVIKALIDWEFCYTAPREFLSAPPPWLIPNPDPWDWSSEERDVFRIQFLSFIKVLQDEDWAKTMAFLFRCEINMRMVPFGISKLCESHYAA